MILELNSKSKFNRIRKTSYLFNLDLYGEQNVECYYEYDNNILKIRTWDREIILKLLNSVGI
jgi:hypothetical protein